MAREDLISGLWDGEVFRRLAESPEAQKALAELHKVTTTAHNAVSDVRDEFEKLREEFAKLREELGAAIKAAEAKVEGKKKTPPSTETKTD